MCRSTEAKTLEGPASSSLSFPNQKWTLKQRPHGMFKPETDVELIDETIVPSVSCEDDEVIIETSVLSVDAFIRTMLDEEAYHGSVSLGGTVPAFGYGKVVYAGKKSKVKVGKEVAAMFGAQSYAKVKASETFPKFNFPFMSPTASLGLMSLTAGITAYAGVFYVCKKPKKGETVVVTGAAGAVGSVAAQLAKSTGARVVGIAGGEKKQSYLLDTLKLDGAVDYKKTDESLSDQIAKLCPNGIDFIYDNVGGSTLDVLLEKINPSGRVVICGAISQYSGNLNKGLVQGPSNYLKLAERGATMKGFNVMQYIMRMPLMWMGMFWMYMRGQVIMTEHIDTGIESFPHALLKLFTGGHTGKMLVDVKGGDDDSSHTKKTQ